MNSQNSLLINNPIQKRAKDSDRQFTKEIRNPYVSSVLREMKARGIPAVSHHIGTLKRWILASAETLVQTAENTKRCSHLERQLAVFSKVKCGPTMGASLSPPRYLSEKNKSRCPQKSLYTNVHSSFTYNIPKMKTPHTPSTGERVQ